MKTSAEQIWISLTNSAGFRQFAKRGPGANLFQSQAYQSLQLKGLYALSRVQTLREPSIFAGVKTCCLFIGHTKSGNSMIGSLLDAHPNAVVSDEADILRFIPAGFRREQIFYLLYRASRREALKGRVTARRLGGYSWQVPNQWQGKSSSIQVIGDSTSGTTTRRLAQSPDLLPRFAAVLGEANLRFVHMVRNPFDPLSIMMVRGKRSFENAFSHFAAGCDYLQNLSRRIGEENIFRIHYEPFIAQPKPIFDGLLSFLDLSSSEAYLQACTQVLHNTPQQARQMVQWKPEWIAMVTHLIDQVQFLEGYSFNN